MTEPTGTDPNKMDFTAVLNAPRSPEANQTSTDLTTMTKAHPDAVGPSDWEQVAPDLREALESAIADAHWPIYLFGAPGRGKSCAAACVYHRFIGWALWRETARYVSEIMECRTNGRGYIVRNGVDLWEGAMFRKIEQAGLVVWDDFGLRSPSPAAYEIIFNAVNVRRGKPTIYTSNLEPRQLGECYDQRITSRVLCGRLIAVGGDDRRLEGAKLVRTGKK